VSLVEEQNLQGQITLLEGDFLGTKLETDYDVVLISGVVLIKSEEDSRSLLKIAYDALLPGGMAIVQDYMRIDHSPERVKLDTLENMYVMVAFDPDAGDREGDEVASWLRDAGFQNPNLIPLPTQLALITAEKPTAQ
jgi:SAM-dependent methyltransferase